MYDKNTPNNINDPIILLFVDMGLVLGTGKNEKISTALNIFCPVVYASSSLISSTLSLSLALRRS